MSSTRRSNVGDPMAYEKYMSAPEFVALRPIPGNAVLSKALLYTDAKAREMAFFLQAMSMRPGGLKVVAGQLVSWFPERCNKVGGIEDYELPDYSVFLRPPSKAAVRNLVRSLKEGRGEPVCSPDEELKQTTVELLADFLVELILNPGLSLTKIEAKCFRNLGGALLQYKAAQEKAALEGFVCTTAGAAVHETLSQALSRSRMVVVEGTAGVGKSTNAQAWCAARPGLVRYISLTGITNRTTFFQKIGSAIGLATCQRKAQELQAKTEDFFSRSKMMLVIDEAHFLWPQSLRVMTAPELIDWIDTALVNQGVPVALLCTDQFSKLKSRVEKQTGWTSEQFIHRVFRFKKLEEKPSEIDVKSVTRSLLSSVWDEARQQWIASDHACTADVVEGLVAYGMAQKIPLSCVSSCVHEARAYAREAGRSLVSRADIQRALRSGQIPSDAALARAFTSVPTGRRNNSRGIAPGELSKPNKAFVSTRSNAELPLASPARAVFAADNP